MSIHSYRRLFHLLLCAACALTLACGSSAPPAGPATPATREVVDDIGRHVQVAARPERIVSLAPSITEILYAIGAGDRIVATTSFCTFPPEAANTTKIGDTQRPDVERILALKPDLVLVSTASQLESISERLGALGVSTVVTTAKGVEGVMASTDRFGVPTGDPEAAASAMLQLEETLRRALDRKKLGSR